MLFTIIIGTIIAVLFIYGIKSMLKKSTSGCCQSGECERRIKPKDKNINHYPYSKHLSINDMHCQNCAIKIENNFNQEDSYYAKVILTKKELILHSKQEIDEQRIIKQISQLGYHAKVIVSQ